MPADAFVFDEAFAAEPELVVDIERVVAADDGYLTPYFWVSGVSEEAFEAVARSEGSIGDLRRLDQFEASTLYRADWREDVNALVYAWWRSRTPSASPPSRYPTGCGAPSTRSSGTPRA